MFFILNVLTVHQVKRLKNKSYLLDMLNRYILEKENKNDEGRTVFKILNHKKKVNKLKRKLMSFKKKKDGKEPGR